MTAQGQLKSTASTRDHFPFDGEEHALLIAAHIKLLIAIEQLEKRLWTEWWPSPPPSTAGRRRRKSSARPRRRAEPPHKRR